MTLAQELQRTPRHRAKPRRKCRPSREYVRQRLAEIRLLRPIAVHNTERPFSVAE